LTQLQVAVRFHVRSCLRELVEWIDMIDHGPDLSRGDGEGKAVDGQHRSAIGGVEELADLT
jgi:hypothetical protein